VTIPKLRRISLYRCPLVITATLVITAVFSLPPLVNVSNPEAPVTASLRTSLAYDVVAPFSNILDALTLLSLAQYAAMFALCAGTFIAFWTYGNARSHVVLTPWKFARAMLGFVGATVAVAGTMLVCSRPMASLTLTDPDLIAVDFHSHTEASHDGRAGFNAERNREWHANSGFGAAYVTDHSTFDGALSGAARNPVRAGNGTVLLPGVELRDGDEHPILIGVDPKRMRITSPDWQRAAVEADGGPAPAMLLLSMPGDILRIPFDETSGAVRVAGIEAVDGSPRGIGQSWLGTDGPSLERDADSGLARHDTGAAGHRHPSDDHRERVAGNSSHRSKNCRTAAKCCGSRARGNCDHAGNDADDESFGPLVVDRLELEYLPPDGWKRPPEDVRCTRERDAPATEVATGHRSRGVTMPTRTTTSPAPNRQPGRARRVRDWFRKLLTFWTLIVLVSALAIGVFADLGEDVAENSTVGFDNAIRAWMIAHQNPIVYKIAYVITWIGSPGMLLIAIVAGAWFLRRGGHGKAGVVVAAPAFAALISGTVKLFFGRARPAGGLLLNLKTFSFPSGHATSSAAVAVTLSYVLARERIISWPVAIIIGAIVPLAVGFTRLYLDVHWGTDVIGGWLVGLFVAAMCAALYEYLRKSAPPDAVIAAVNAGS